MGKSVSLCDNNKKVNKAKKQQTQQNIVGECEKTDRSAYQQ